MYMERVTAKQKYIEIGRKYFCSLKKSIWLFMSLFMTDYGYLIYSLLFCVNFQGIKETT